MKYLLIVVILFSFLFFLPSKTFAYTYGSECHLAGGGGAVVFTAHLASSSNVNDIPLTIQLFKNGVAQGGTEILNLKFQQSSQGTDYYQVNKDFTLTSGDTNSYAYYYHDNIGKNIVGGCAFGALNPPPPPPPTDPLCPEYVGFQNDSNGFSLILKPSSSIVDNVKFNVSGNSINKKYSFTSTLSPFGTFWIANLTDLPIKTNQYTGNLIVEGMPVHDCWTMNFTRGEGPDGGGGNALPGKNPCEGGTCITALGSFTTDIKGFTTKILQIAIGLAGGLALILMVRGSISVLTSQGDPQKVNAGREVIVAAIAGLLFLIFSVLILRYIGIKILGGIPGIS